MDAAWQRVVEYVGIVDTDPTSLTRVPSPTLSQVFSGMRLSVRDPAEQFRQGMRILHTVVARGIDPFGTMPELPHWQTYLRAKRANDAALAVAECGAQIRISHSGRRVGIVETEAIGALGLLYAMGSDIALVCHPRFGEPPVRKITIGSRGATLYSVLVALNRLEPGWGGAASGTIIGSPRTGTQLPIDQILQLVLTMF